MTTLAQAAESRLVSLDVFRGATMAAMVIVNNPGDWSNVYAPLLHAPWHGLTPTDLIFPFFLFIVGISITLARRSSATSLTIVRRAALIFALGFLLAWYPRFDLSTVRIPGVLQRIAVCYLIVALFHRATAEREWKVAARDAVLAATVLLVGYWLLIRGDLTPSGNLGAAIDRALFAEHLWRQSRTWDPEGLLSTMPAVATTLTGLAYGRVLRGTPEHRVRLLTAASVIALIAGVLWSFAFPLNKSLWTSSYVLVTSGLAGLALIALHVAVDRQAGTKVPAYRGGVGRDFSPGDQGAAVGRGFSPGGVARAFVILGRNALLLFVVSGFLVKTMALVRVSDGAGGTLGLSRWIYLAWFAPLASPKNASLLYAIANLAVLFMLLWWLDRRRWYWRV